MLSEGLYSVTTFRFAKARFSAAAKICPVGNLLRDILLDVFPPMARYAL